MTERATYATLVGMVAYAAIATDLYLPAIPAMIDAFGATEAQGQLTLSIFMLGMAAGQLIFGPLSDYHGRIPVITAGTALFVATSVGCALANSMEVMWLARLAQGLAAASGPVIARAIVRDRYHGDRAAQVMSMLGAAMAVIPLIAPTVGSWVLVWVHWRATFVALALFGVLILVGLRTFRESAPAIGEGSIRLIPVLQLFSVCLRNRQFIGFQLCGTATYAAILAYLSTVAYFMRDVFALPPA
ncbi:MAG: MFS transporter, partial [Luminiphilus sp.]